MDESRICARSPPTAPRVQERFFARAAPPLVLAVGRVASSDALRAGGKVLAFGNGGSAADAQHLAAELVGRYLRDRPGAARASRSPPTRRS